LPAGEENKNMHSLTAILDKMVAAGMQRTSKLFAVGGGVIGDIGGLSAALYMRGIACVQIPTTLLAQVDSSVGGKTAVDHNGVKNIIGAFYQPQEVLINPQFLQTLPAREIKCGLGEIVKYAALSEEMFHVLNGKTEQELCDLCLLSAWIEQCVSDKIAVVQADEKESGERKSLNVGHTTGHAIELAYGISHGESVLYGTWLETYIAIQAGVCNHEYGEKLLAIIQTALRVLPVEKRYFSQIAKYAENAKSDKKNIDDAHIVMSVAKNIGEWALLSMPFEEYQTALVQAMQAMQSKVAV
jgi:3-dehydroquinate synthase